MAFDVEAWVKFTAMVITSGLGIFLLGRGRRTTASVYLAVFLLFIAANHGFEWLRVMQEASTTSIARRLATIVAALDPVWFYMFGATFPSRNRLHTPWAVAIVVAAGSILTVLAVFIAPVPVGTVAEMATWVGLNLFTALVYTIVLVSVMSRMLAGDVPPAYHYLYPGMAIAVIPIWTRLGETTTAWMSALAGGNSWDPAAQSLVITLVFVIIVVDVILFLLARMHGAGHIDRPTRKTLVWGTVAGGVVGLLIHARQLHHALQISGVQVPDVNLDILFSVSAALRWILFSVFVAYAVWRLDLFDTAPAADQHVGDRASASNAR